MAVVCPRFAFSLMLYVLCSPVSAGGTCDSFKCPTHYLAKADAAEIHGQDTDACCDPSCRLFDQCPTNKMLKRGSDTMRGSDAGTCCGHACSGFTCPSNYVWKDDPAKI